MKAFLASLVAIVALLAVGAASAYITPPAASVSATQCFVGSHSVTVASGGYLRFGWGTISNQQALDFLAAQNFTLTATGTNSPPKFTTGTFTLASWGTGNTDSWTEPRQVSVGGRPIYQTTAFVQVNLAPGDYTLSTAGTSVSRAVFDGEAVTKKGENWYPITGCLLIVT
jgi:hypothetical protein